ncbi:myb-like protein AA [Ptychodera flava]|uniref:myb-like protein AA n=1 Tax=Ptychodera flava TaxID=63121 RepID=UPI003969D798
MFTSTNPAAGRGHHSQVGASTVDHTVPVQSYDFANQRVQQEGYHNNGANGIVAHSDALAENMKGFECSDLDNALLSGQAPPNGDFSFPFNNAQGHQVRAMHHGRMPVDMNSGNQTFSPLTHGRAGMDGYPYDDQGSVQGRPRSNQPSVTDSAIGEDFHQSTESVFSPGLHQNLHQGDCHVDSYGRTRRVSDPCPQVTPGIQSHGAAYQRTNSFPTDNINMRTQYNNFPANRGITQNGSNMGNNVQTFYPNPNQTGHSNTQNVDTTLPGIYERSTDSQPPSISPHVHGQNLGYPHGRSAGNLTMNASVSKPMEYMPQGSVGHTTHGTSQYQGMASNSTTVSNSRLHHLPPHIYQQYGNPPPPQHSPNPAPTAQVRQYPPHMQPRLNHPQFTMGNGNPPYGSSVTFTNNNNNNQHNFQSVDCAKPMFHGTQGNMNANVNMTSIGHVPNMQGLPRYPGNQTRGQPRYPAPQQGYMPNSGMPNAVNKTGHVGINRGGMDFQNANPGASQRLRHFGPMLENGLAQPKYPPEQMQGYARHPTNAIPPNYTGMPPMGDSMGMADTRPPSSMTHPPIRTPATQTQRYRYNHPETYPPSSATANVIPSGQNQNFPESVSGNRRYSNERSARASRVSLAQEASFAKVLQAMAKRDYPTEQVNPTWAEVGPLQGGHPQSIPDGHHSLENSQEPPDLSAELGFSDDPELLEKRGDLVFSAELEKLAKLSRNPIFLNYQGMTDEMAPPGASQPAQQGHGEIVMNTDQNFATGEELISNGQDIGSPNLEISENQLPSFEELVADRNPQQQHQVSKEEDVQHTTANTTTVSSTPTTTVPTNNISSVPSIPTPPANDSPHSISNASIGDFQETNEHSDDTKIMPVEKSLSPAGEELSKQTEENFQTAENQNMESPNAVKQLQRMTQSLKDKQEEVSKSRHVQYLSHNSDPATTSSQNCIAALSAACRNMIADLDSPVQRSINHQLYNVVSDNGLHSPNYEAMPSQFPQMPGMVPSPFIQQNPTFQGHQQPMDSLSSIGCSPVTDAGQQTPNCVSPGTFHLQYQNFLHEPVDMPVEPKQKRKPRAKKRNLSQDGDDVPKKQRRKKKKTSDSGDFSALEGEVNSVESSVVGSIDEQTNKMLDDASLVVSESEHMETSRMTSAESSATLPENSKSSIIENSSNVLSTPPDIQSSSPLDAVTLATISSESPVMITSPPSLSSPRSQPIASASTPNEVPDGLIMMQQQPLHQQHQQPGTPNVESASNNNNTIPNNKQNAETNSFVVSQETANNISSCPGSVNSVNDKEERATGKGYSDTVQSRPSSQNSQDGKQAFFDLNCLPNDIATSNNASIPQTTPSYPNTSISMSSGAPTCVTPVCVPTSCTSVPPGMGNQAAMHPGYPVVNNNQPPEAHPLEILQAQIQLQRQQFNISESRPLPYKNPPKVSSGPKSKTSKATKPQNPVDVEKLIAEEDSTWYMPNEAPKEPTVPWEQSKKNLEKAQNLDPNQVDRRTLHKISEQKRRESLKHSIDVLKRAVPDCRDLNDQSQQNVLLRAHNYIVDMLGKQQRSKMCAEELDSLKNCNNRLQDEISILRQECELISKIP